MYGTRVYADTLIYAHTYTDRKRLAGTGLNRLALSS